ncbi:folate-binding protein YgfZ [Acetobacteraceae bacterium]|nr:folate-binding protein YgfZ [Acetobacteraceae bacterium]
MYLYSLTSQEIIKVSGEGRKDFLQPLVTCDLLQLSNGSALYGAFLTPQGKIRTTFFLFEAKNELFLEVPKSQIENILKYLSKLKLRHKVNFAKSSLKAFASPSLEKLSPKIKFSFKDPRATELGWKLLSEDSHLSVAQKDEASYTEYLAKFGILSDTLILQHRNTNYPSEMNLDLFHAIAWNKGCYVGQEVVARFHHRNLTKKRSFLLTSLQQKETLLTEDSDPTDRTLFTKEGKVAGSVIYETSSTSLLAFVLKTCWNEKIFQLKGEFFEKKNCLSYQKLKNILK